MNREVFEKALDAIRLAIQGMNPPYDGHVTCDVTGVTIQVDHANRMVVTPKLKMQITF